MVQSDEEIDPTIPRHDIQSLGIPRQEQSDTLCKCFVEDLRGDYPELKLGSECPFCSHFIHEHRMKCDQVILASPLSEQRNHNNGNPHNYAKSFRALKKSNLLPVWNRNKSICKLFLEDIRRVLRISEIPKSCWYMVFAYVVHEHDYTSANWIHQHITEPEVSDFEQACSIFTQHFELRTYEFELQQKWNKIQ